MIIALLIILEKLIKIKLICVLKGLDLVLYNSCIHHLEMANIMFHGTSLDGPLSFQGPHTDGDINL